MNLNKNFLTEVIKYLINRGVTLADVLDTFNEHFNTSDNAIKYEHKNHDEVRKPITDIDLLLCGRELEKQGFNKDIKEHVTVTGNITESPYKLVAIPPTKVSLSPNNRDYPTSTAPRGRGVSKARKMLFEVVEGKTVLEHLKANNINYKLFDTRIRKNWTMEKACTTPMSRVIKPYTKSKKPEEHKAVIIPDTHVICLEPEKITGTKVTTAIIDDIIPAENTAENVTIEPQTKTDTDTRVNDTNANSDAIHEDKDDYIEKALKKFITSTTGIEFEESKKDKKPKETKSDLTVLEVCQKMNVTTHELKEMIATGDFPQPDCDKKWSVKLLKKEGII